MPDRLKLIPPKPGDLIVHLGQARRGIVPAIVVGTDSGGALRVNLREYHLSADGHLHPKRGGVSFKPSEFQRIAQQVLAAVAGYHPVSNPITPPARIGP